MRNNLKEEFLENGYVIIDVLSEKEISEFRVIMDKLLSPKVVGSNDAPKSSSFQHLGDNLEDFGKEARQYYFHLLTNPGTESIHHAFCNPIILETVEEIIGPDLIVNNASILAANVGTSYSLGWHRDVIQIPEEDIQDWLFSAERFHNSVQINLPLVDESSLWIVPKSHNRPNTKEENEAFCGSKHYAPIGVKMPGAIPVNLKAGQAVLYNNNLIHRGYTETMKVPRRTLHMGYHSNAFKPTWHFYLLNNDLLTEDYLETLDPAMRIMMDKYMACRKEYPNMEDTWKKEYMTNLIM
ncbi:phytanoyl-CoA dioxygenase family protein [uncultured Algibacter sp.]|uniref:phytanoyl-CoA dioxygenase family protein n=1 Tax=uncultured Algibacter sp. TaxID=298659 RepID=UPI002617891D|nr:phytanoyl-CoA dioxygenase family protein [uncultured Algibacter sp.]